MESLIGAYIIKFKDSGKFYIGSTSNFYSRKSSHLFMLKRGVHSNSNVQEEYNKNPDPGNLLWTFFKTDDREDAYKIEEKIMSNYDINDPLLLNISTDVRSSISGFKLSDEAQKRKIKNIRKAVRTIEHRNLQSKIGIKGWEDQERRKARSGGFNPFAKPIVCYGILYGSVKEAERELGIGEKTLRYRANDPESPNVNWFTGKDSEYRSKFNKDYSIDPEKIKRNFKMTSINSKYMKSRTGSNNGAARNVYFRGQTYSSVKEASEKSGYSQSTITRSFPPTSR